MKSWKKILLYPALALSLLGKAEAQQYRITELSSFPRKGIYNAVVELNNTSRRTDLQGYYDPLTSVGQDNKDNVRKLAKISSTANGISFKVDNENNADYASLAIFNILGQEIYKAKGNSITWDLRNNNDKKVSSGVYLYRIESNNAVESGLLNLLGNDFDLSAKRNLSLKQKNNFQNNNLGKASKESRKEGTLSKGGVGTVGSNVVSCVDTIYCTPELASKSTHHLEKILKSLYAEKSSKLNKVSNVDAGIIFRVSKDTSFYVLEDTLESISKLPSNAQLLENVDMGKSDGIRSLEYVKLFTNGSVNYGAYETTYPLGVFLDSAAIFNNPIIQSRDPARFLKVLRDMLQETNDSLRLNMYYEASNSSSAKVRFDYINGGSFTLTYYNIDANGNPTIDSARIHLNTVWADAPEALRQESRHELGHSHISLHSPYNEDVTNPTRSAGKTYTKGDKFLFRVMVLGTSQPGWRPVWKKFKNY